MISNYKGLVQANNLELLGHQPSILLTLVLFPRVEVPVNVKNDGFSASEFKTASSNEAAIKTQKVISTYLIRSLIYSLNELFSRFFTFAVTVYQIRGDIASEKCELQQLFHHIYHPVVIGRGLHTSVFLEFKECFGNRTLIWNSEHTHPAS